MNKLISQSLAHLAHRWCSERELRLKLEREFSNVNNVKKQIETVIPQLKALQLLDDRHIAQSLAQRYRHKGNGFITQALQQKGIHPTIISETLTQLGDESQRAFFEATKKLVALRDECPQQIETSLFRFLSGRGFLSQTIHQTLRRLKEKSRLNTIN